jgi:ABC-type enterochelin transport system ATPase subunit
MKQTILAMAMMLMTGLTGAFAKNNEGISNEITTSFNKDFASATNVSWNKQKNFTKATFTMSNQVMFAYYDENGSLIASARNILSEQLPINLMNDLKKGYSNYWISELFEMDKEGQASYYVTLENADETLILRSSSSNSWSTYKRSKKI